MTPQDILNHLGERFQQYTLGSHAFRGDATVMIRHEGLLDVARYLKSEPLLAFNVLMDVTAVDYKTFDQVPFNSPSLTTPSPLPFFMTSKPVADEAPWQRHAGEDQRFEVVYHFYSILHRHRVRLKVAVMEDDATVPSLTALWPSANWYEREVWDMFGIRFSGHPDLKRILMYEGFEGHPLRKDYPVNKRQPLIGPKN